MIEPGSREWLRTITPSKIPVILGVSRFQSTFSLWHEMAGIVEPAPVDQARQDMFDEGHALEAAARALWLRRNPGWRASRGEVQYVRDDLTFRMAATLDLRATRKGRPSNPANCHIVECKSARSLEEWGDDGSGDVPVDYLVQVVAQMGISGIRSADLMLWPLYGRPKQYRVEWDREMWDHILDRCHAWHVALQQGKPPALDDTVACYETVRALHPDIRDEEIVIDQELADEIRFLHRKQRDLKQQDTGARSRLLAAMSGAKTARDPEGHVVATLTARAAGKPYPKIKDTP